MFRRDLSEATPKRLITLAGTKFLLLWGLDWGDPDITLRPTYLLPWAVLNVLTLAGAVVAVRRRMFTRTGLMIGAVMLAGLTAAYVLSAVHARYRMHLEPFLFLLAGVALAEIWNAIVLRLPRTWQTAVFRRLGSG